MFRNNIADILMYFFAFTFLYSVSYSQKTENNLPSSSSFKLPDPRIDSVLSIEKALNNRRSIRHYSEDSLSIFELSQILWAAQGITKKIEKPPSIWRGEQWQSGLRTAPSAGGLYPIELYIAVGKVKGLPQGFYKYIPQQHSILKVMDGDKRNNISNAALKQRCIQRGAINIIIFGVYQRTAFKYGKRAGQYVQIECGAVCQNIYLQATALDLGTVFIGAFKDDSLKSTLNIPENEHPLGIMPVGKIKKEKNKVNN